MTMRRAARIDANQPAIVDALRKVGCRVQPLHMVGKGCPDILVGKGGRVLLMEIKDGTKPPSARKLTADEQVWHDLWADVAKTGSLVVVASVGEALEAVEAL
jgi:Holliday junction resolvase